MATEPTTPATVEELASYDMIGIRLGTGRVRVIDRCVSWGSGVKSKRWAERAVNGYGEAFEVVPHKTYRSGQVFDQRLEASHAR